MRTLELVRALDADECENWEEASEYYTLAQQTAYNRILRSRKLTPAEKSQWCDRISKAFATIQQAYTTQFADNYDMKNAMLTACDYAASGRNVMSLDDVEANLLHIAFLLADGVAIPHPDVDPWGVDNSRRDAERNLPRSV